MADTPAPREKPLFHSIYDFFTGEDYHTNMFTPEAQQRRIDAMDEEIKRRGMCPSPIPIIEKVPRSTWEEMQKSK